MGTYTKGLLLVLLLFPSLSFALPKHYLDEFPTATVFIEHCGQRYLLSFSNVNWSLGPEYLAMTDLDNALMVAKSSVIFSLKTDCGSQGLKYRVIEP